MLIGPCLATISLGRPSMMPQWPPPYEVCWSETEPRTLLISLSTSGVYFLPAALPDTMQLPSRVTSCADISVKLHQPTYPGTLPRWVFFRPHQVIMRLV